MEEFSELSPKHWMRFGIFVFIVGIWLFFIPLRILALDERSVGFRKGLIFSTENYMAFFCLALPNAIVDSCLLGDRGLCRL